MNNKFNASRGAYTFSGATGDAVIVQTGRPWSFVFWEQACYIPWWHIDDGTAFCYEFFETWGDGYAGCCEPMSDRENRYSRVRIRQSHAARSVVHWRYALCDPNYRIYDGGVWADEIYTFYPDGYGIRQATLRPVRPIEKHEILEFIVVNAAGTAPLDTIERKALTIMNTRGEVRECTWPKDRFPRETDGWENCIYRINLRDRPAPFAIISQQSGHGFPGYGLIHVPFTLSQKIDNPDVFFSCGHWPISREPLNGQTYLRTNDFSRPSSTSLIALHARGTTDTDRTWLFFIGVVETRDGAPLVELAESWTNPAEIRPAPGTLYTGYVPGERAYTLEAEGRRAAAFSLRPGRKTINPVFRISGVDPRMPAGSLKILCDGRAWPAEKYRAGTEAGVHGADLVIWCDAVLEAKADFRMEWSP